MDYNNQIPFLKIGSKIKIIIHNDRIKIVRRRKNHLHLYGEIKNIEYKTKRFGKEDCYLLRITKTNKKVYKYKLGLIEEKVLEIFTIIKNNYEEWRIKIMKVTTKKIKNTDEYSITRYSISGIILKTIIFIILYPIYMSLGIYHFMEILSSKIIIKFVVGSLPFFSLPLFRSNFSIF